MSEGTGLGRFVVFEGPEGAGKSLQIERLSCRLSERGVAHVTTREPGGTAAAEAIREVILERPELRLDGIAELLLFSAARRAHVEEIIRPALERGDVVLCDRFELSTRVYQGWARRVPAETVGRVTRAATGGLLPDLYLVIDVRVSVGLDRQWQNQEKTDQLAFFAPPPDRIESEARSFRERVRERYLELAATDDRIEVVDGAGAPDEVERAILALLEERFPNPFRGPSFRR
ncbi:dTMP kinase [Candidatus Palauibacter sp.]|uniref:dTMP kinase n=1 Tax=Candidatus Palauibacter sp. TaxID=3101350 RepID=UPI003AF23738